MSHANKFAPTKKGLQTSESPVVGANLFAFLGTETIEVF